MPISAARGALGAPWVLAHNWRSVPALITGVDALCSRGARILPVARHPLLCGQAGRKDGPRLTAPGSAAALQFALLPGSADAPLDKGKASQAAAEWTAAEVARLLAAAARGEARLGEAPAGGGMWRCWCAPMGRVRRWRPPCARAGWASRAVLAKRLCHRRGSGFGTRPRAVLMPTRLNWLKGALATALLDGTLPSILELDRDELALERLLERFQSHHEIWQRRGFMSMWQSLMATHGVAARLLARPDGERMLTNVQHLAELLHDAAIRDIWAPRPCSPSCWLAPVPGAGRRGGAVAAGKRG